MRFLRNDKGAAAVEFALVAAPFFALVISIIEISYKTVQQTAVDNLMFDFAMTLSREDDAGVTKSEYKSNVICGRNASVVLDCDSILFGAEAYSTNVSIYGLIDNVFVDSWSTGCEGSTVIAEVMYPVPHIVVPFAVADIVRYRGEDYYRSRAVIRREPTLSGSGTTSGGGSC